MALHGGCFDTSHPHQKYNYHHVHQEVNLGVENWICDTGQVDFTDVMWCIPVWCQLLPGPASSDILTGYKERRDSTGSDKENELESNNSNAFNCNQQHHQHQEEQADLLQVCQETNVFNEKSATDTIRESHTEEDLDHLLTDLFSEDDANGADNQLLLLTFHKEARQCCAVRIVHRNICGIKRFRAVGRKQLN